MDITFTAYNEIATLRASLAALEKTAATNKPVIDAAQALDNELGQIQNGTAASPGFGAINRDVNRYVTMIQSGDMRPAETALENAKSACSALRNDLTVWRRIANENLPALNKTLQQSKLRTLSVPSVANEPACPN